MWHYSGMTLSERIEKTGLTDDAIAAKAGCSRPHITKIRHRQRTPSLKLAVRLSQITKIPVAAFLSIDGEAA